ncbi:MAG: hypothetical protein G8D89_20900 [gamma proteobacterium symbiont of Clathrolucina costata]
MHRREEWSKHQLCQRILKLENAIRAISTAPNELEQKARIEITLAEVDGRKPEKWAEEYMDYATSTSEQYF